MHKLFTVVLLCLVILSPSLAVSSVHTLATLMADQQVTSNNVLRYEVSINEPRFTKLGDYDLVLLPESGFTSDPGKPALPTKTVAILLPPNKDLDGVEVHPLNSYELPGEYLIAPAPEPKIIDEDTSKMKLDQELYSQSTSYPGTIYNFQPKVQEMRGYKFIFVTLYPVQYIPSERKLIFHSELEIKVQLKPSEPSVARPFAPIAHWLTKSVINPEMTAEYDQTQYSNSLGYLIITRSIFSSAATSLKSIYEARNFTVYIKYVEDIITQYPGIDIPEKIRNCIIGYYYRHNITYVLLLGDVDPDDALAPPYIMSVLDKDWEVPARYVFNPDPDEGYDELFTGLPNDFTPTDYYYAGLDGTWDLDNDYLYGESRYYSYYDEADWFPEVFVGRIPVRTASEANATVAKIGDFYGNLETFQRQFLLTGAQLFNMYAYTDGAWVKELVAQMYPQINKMRLYESLGNLTYINVIDAINTANPLLVDSASHGGIDALWLYWPTGKLYDQALTWYNFTDINTPNYISNKGFLWYASTCLSGAYDVDGTCVGEAMILDPDGSAIAYIGATRVVWVYIKYWFLFGLAGMQDWLYWYLFSICGNYGAGVTLYMASAVYSWCWWWSVSECEWERKNLFAQMLIGDPAISPFTGKVEPTFQIARKGDSVEISGTGFAPNATLNFYLRHFYVCNLYLRYWLPEFNVFENFLVGTTSTNGTGGFSANFAVPLTVPSTFYDILVVDEYSNLAWGGYLFVTRHTFVEASPNKGYGHFIIDLNCIDFPPFSLLSVSIDGAPIIGTTSLALGFTDETGRLKTSIAIPTTKPGIYQLTIRDAYGLSFTLPIYVIDTTLLAVEVGVGSIHFRGELAEFYILTSFNRTSVNATITKAMLYYSTGTISENLTTSVSQIATGLYRVPYEISVNAPIGTYTLVVEAEYVTDIIESKGASFKSFLVSPTLTGWNAMLQFIEGNIGIINTDIGVIKTNLTEIKAELQAIEGNTATLNTTLGLVKAKLDTLNATLAGLITTSKGEIIARINTALGTLEAKLDTVLTMLDTMNATLTEIKLAIEGWTGASSTVAGYSTIALTTSELIEAPEVINSIIRLVVSGPAGTEGRALTVIQKSMLEALGSTIDDVVILIDTSPIIPETTEYNTYYVLRISYIHSEHVIIVHLTGNLDPDKDGVKNWKEYVTGTNPALWDTDGDWWADAIDPWPTTPLLPNAVIASIIIAVAVAAAIIKRVRAPVPPAPSCSSGR